MHFALQSWRGPGDGVPAPGIMERVEAYEVSLALWSLDAGAVVSVTSPHVGKGHGRCPNPPSLEILSFEGCGGLCSVSVRARLGFTTGS